MSNKPNIVMAVLYAIFGYFVFNLAYNIFNIIFVRITMWLSFGRIQAFLIAIAAAYLAINIVSMAIAVISKYGKATNKLAMRIAGVAVLVFNVYQASHAFAVGGIILPNIVAALAAVIMII